MASLFDRIASSLPGMGGEEKKLEQASDQSTDEKKLVSHIRQKIDEARSANGRTVQEGQWMTNTAYVLGYDGVYFDPTTRQYRTIGAGTRGLRRSRLRVNKILPTLQNRTARLCKNPPKYDVRPNSNSQDDKDAARLGVEFIEYTWERESINEKRIDMTMIAQQCGYAFFHVGWDTEYGEPMLDPSTGELSYEGDICIEACSPFEIYQDPLAKTMKEAAWFARVKVRKLDYFRDKYERGYLVKEEDAWLLSTQYELKLNALNTTQGTADYQRQMQNAAIEITYYEKRSKKHPNGRMIVCANGVLLEDKDLPVGEIPLVKFDDIKVGGRFASEALVTHLRPVQDQYNNVVRKRADWTNKLLAGKYIAAKGHGLSSEAINNESGEVVEYDPVPNASEPKAMDIPNMPAYVYQETEELNREFDQISGINEVSRGVMPSAGIPAVGMQFLQEQDETRIGIETEQHEHSYAGLGKLILMYGGKFYSMPRKIKLAGEGLEYTVKQFTGDQLQNNFDVIVIRGSTIPGSKVMKRQEIINAYMTGFLGDPADPKVRQKVAGMLEYGDVGEMWRDQAIKEARVKKLLEAAKQGIVFEQDEMDPHDMIAEEFNIFRMTDSFDELAPEAQAAILEVRDRAVDMLTNLMNPGLGQDEELAQEMVQQAEMMPEESVDPMMEDAQLMEEESVA